MTPTYQVQECGSVLLQPQPWCGVEGQVQEQLSGCAAAWECVHRLSALTGILFCVFSLPFQTLPIEKTLGVGRNLWL